MERGDTYSEWKLFPDYISRYLFILPSLFKKAKSNAEHKREEGGKNNMDLSVFPEQSLPL